MSSFNDFGGFLTLKTKMETGDDVFITQNSFSLEELPNVDDDILSLFLESESKSSEAEDADFRHNKPVSAEEMKNLIEGSIPDNTRSHYNWAYRVFANWQNERKKRPIHENLDFDLKILSSDIMAMDKTEMNTALQYFIAEVKKSNGNNYPAQTLHQLYVALQGYVRMSGKTDVNFLTDHEFDPTRKVLDTMMKRRTSEGLGINSRKPAETITLSEEEMLWKKGYLGSDTPQKLLNTIVYLNGIHFALRGGVEHRNLRLNDNPQITGPFIDSDTNTRYILYKEDMSKNNCGGMKHKQYRPKSVRAYENSENPEQCIVRLYEKYISLW